MSQGSLDAEVLIAGAGVAGCALALHLARGGRTVALVERERFPREKVCGEGLMPHGVAELDRLGLLDAVRATGAMRFDGIAYHAGGATALGRFPSVAASGRGGLGIRRWQLDALLAQACEREPRISLRTGVRVTAVERGDAVALRTPEGALRGRVLVGADGRGSVVRRALDLQAKVGAAPRYGVRAHYRLAPGRPDRDVVDVFMAPRCEFYLTPTGPGEVNVAILLERELSRGFGGDLAGGFDRLAQGFEPIRALLAGATALTEPRLVGPLRQRARRLVADRALLVGDAAGFVDAITGEGMSLALVSARLAAETLEAALAAGDLSAAALRPYERSYRARARDLTLLAEIVLWGIRRPAIARRVVRNLARHPDVFSRVLGVNSGHAPLSSVRPSDLWRIVIG